MSAGRLLQSFGPRKQKDFEPPPLTAAALSQLGTALKHAPAISYAQKRHFFKFLNAALNKFDRERYKKFGADRVCAEWILRSGGRLRWAGSDEWLADYNFLPPESAVEHYKVQDLDGSGSGVMKQGFEHIRYLEHLKSVKLHNCTYVDNYCLKALEPTSNTLERLQISSCKKVTDDGLVYLKDLVRLTDLHLKDLTSVRDAVGCQEKLQSALPNCDIIFVDADKILGKHTE